MDVATAAATLGSNERGIFFFHVCSRDTTPRAFLHLVTTPQPIKSVVAVSRVSFSVDGSSVPPWSIPLFSFCCHRYYPKFVHAIFRSLSRYRQCVWSARLLVYCAVRVYRRSRGTSPYAGSEFLFILAVGAPRRSAVDLCVCPTDVDADASNYEMPQQSFTSLPIGKYPFMPTSTSYPCAPVLGSPKYGWPRFLPHTNRQRSFDNHSSTSISGLWIVPWTSYVFYFVHVVIAWKCLSISIFDSVFTVYWLNPLRDVIAFSCSILILGDFMFIFGLFENDVVIYDNRVCLTNQS